jgi:hypothetical protein
LDPASGRRQIVRALALFGFAFGLQVGHLVEHLSLAFRGAAFLGPEADSPLHHFLFNTLIALLAVVLVRSYRENPWVYALAAVAVFHELEDAYNYFHFAFATGLIDGPPQPDANGVLARGGILGVLPVAPVDLHNLYNGLEWILLALGFWHQTEHVVAEAHFGPGYANGSIS